MQQGLNIAYVEQDQATGQYHFTPDKAQEPSATGILSTVVSIAGTWGQVDRSDTDPNSLPIIQATKSACLEIALSAYKQRYGVGVEGIAKVTGAGVVITPQGIPAKARRLLEPLRSYL